MGRQHKSDSTATLSSIALLQERFRRLQRLKEMREEKELLKLFPVSERIKNKSSESSSSSSNLQYVDHSSSSLFLHPGLMSNPPTPTLPPAQDSLMYVQSELQSNGHVVDQTSVLNSWAMSSSVFNNFTAHERKQQEVDTSLHL